MIHPTKLISIFFLIIFYFQSDVYCPITEVFGAGLRGGAKGGAATADGAKVGDGGHALATLKGGTHVDASHAGSALDGNIGGLAHGHPLPETPHTHLPTSTAGIADVERAAAISASTQGKLAQTFNKAMDTLAVFSPKLYRRLRTVLFVFKPQKLQDLEGFKLKFQGATPKAQFRMVVDTFHTLTSAKATHTTEELANWAKGIGEAMKVADVEAFQSTLVETQMEVELCNLFLTASKRGADSPLQRSTAKFKNLEAALSNRAQLNRGKFESDGSFRRIPWGEAGTAFVYKELMNIHKDLAHDLETAQELRQKVVADKLVGPLFVKIVGQMGKEVPADDLVVRLNSLIEIAEDWTLASKQLTGIWAQLINKYSLDQRTAAISAIELVHYTIQSFRPSTDSALARSQALRARLTKVFEERPASESFLPPHWMKMKRNLFPQKYSTARSASPPVTK
ncbi:hypothetical protein O181_003752 [Austropuccinia psidii MF-1]|uniref:Uncharacterized protein n=1 Tax=Austropuccinia psidii MF-1 TaxID=1389203 RepID=A0A9Q3GF61_9BASI|nr:hypothetical protein [Austropuccinia psidii MF-1]